VEIAGREVRTVRRRVRNFSAEPIRFFLWSSVNILGTQRAHNFLYPNLSATALWIVVLDTSGMMWCHSFIVRRRFAQISPSISWRRSSEIKDGLPLLCSSWTSVLPSENSRHHFVTFCRVIPYHKQQQFVCEFQLDLHVLRWEIVWRNAPRFWRDFGSALPFQTRLTQTKVVLPLSKEHGSQVEDQGRRQCCHNKHNKFPHRFTRDVSLLSGHAS